MHFPSGESFPQCSGGNWTGKIIQREVGCRLVYEDVGASYHYPRTDAGPYLERGIPIMQFFNGEHPDYHREAASSRYEVRIIDRNGALLRTISRTVPPVLILSPTPPAKKPAATCGRSPRVAWF